MASTTAYRATVLGLLLVMGIVMALSVRDDTLTTDEGLYIPTGYMYVTEHNARFGFEHPPLIRDLAVLPLLSLNLRPAASFFKTDARGRLSAAGPRPARRGLAAAGCSPSPPACLGSRGRPPGPRRS